MKIASKILLIVLLLFGLSLPLAHRAYSMAQISLQNNTSFWLNLYIDGNFGCGPVMPGGFCTSSTTAGSHLLEARKGEEVVSSQSGVNIGEGTSPTWTVTIQDPLQELLKKLNGARFINERTEPPNAAPLARAERELYVRGTTMYWKVRFTWVKRNVQLPRPVGEWRDISQMQITGREIRHHLVIGGDRYDYVFTISEDGNNITEVEKCDKWAYTGTYVYIRK